METVMHAARRPLFVAVLLVAVVSGLTVSWWLLPLGVAVYLAAVVLAARDPELAGAARRARPRGAGDSPHLRALLDEIESTRGEIARSVALANAPLQRLLARVTAQTDELVEQAHALAGKGAVIERFLASVDRRALDDQISRLEVQLPRTSDPYTLQQLSETRTALLDRRTNADALQTYGERIEAQLRNISANLSNVLSETVRLRTADAVSVDAAGTEVADRLRDLNTDMDAFRRMLDTALASSGAAA